MKKKLLIIGAGIEQVPAYEKALEMGLDVVGADMNPNAPAFDLIEDKIIASTYDADETLLEVIKYSEHKKIDGVLTLASDVPLTVAKVAKHFNLEGPSINTAHLTSNKLVQLVQFEKDNIPIPKYREIKVVDELKDIINSWGFPLIIKPLDNRGARGVLRLTDKIDIDWAFNYSMKFSGTDSILVQEFLSGPQISSESLVIDGKCFTAMYSSRNYEYIERFAPYIIENGGSLPAQITDKEKSQLDELVADIAKSLGIKNGSLKGDLVLTENGAMVIEVAGRMGGGYAVSHSIPMTNGINLVEQSIKLAMGLKIKEEDLKPAQKINTVLRFIFPEPGVVTSIKGFDEIEDESVILKRLYVKKGDNIEEVSDHTKRAGLVITSGKTEREAILKAEKTISSIQITTERKSNHNEILS